MLEEITNSNIFTIDAMYQENSVAAIYIIRSENRLALIETGTNGSIPQIEKALANLSLSWHNIDYIILTHIHLDHAGGASQLMELCPNAKLVVHPKGARHMQDPSRLVAGAKAVYGEEYFDKFYGKISPINSERIQQPADNEIIMLADRPLQFINTPGHAYHHHCIIDQQTNSIFTGDTLGVSYPSFRQNDTGYLLPSTSPVQFDPQALHSSVNKIMGYQPNYLYPTHFGVIKPSSMMIASFHEQIDVFVELTKLTVEQHGNTDCENALYEKLMEYVKNSCTNQFPEVDLKRAEKWMEFDTRLNAQGLLVWAEKQQA